MIIFALYMKKRISVLGDGGWGTTVAILLAGKGHDVTLWGAFPDYVKHLLKTRVNEKFLPGIKIPNNLKLISSEDEISGQDICVIAIPSKYLRKTLERFNGKIGEKVVSLTKGIENDTLLRPSEVIKEVLGVRSIASLSGPSISFEVARGLPATVVAASPDKNFREEVQAVFTTPNFRVYTSDDEIGVEIGGAIKNVIAIAAGISDGMGFGVNTKAAILTRGLAEIVRLGEKMGAKKETFFGLSGIGDLATTCMSPHSRNRSFGEEIGKGKTLKDVLNNTEMVVEGVTTAKSAYMLALKNKVEMPITENIYEVVYKNKKPKDAVKELMTRSLKAEVI